MKYPAQVGLACSTDFRQSAEVVLTAFAQELESAPHAWVQCSDFADCAAGTLTAPAQQEQVLQTGIQPVRITNALVVLLFPLALHRIGKLPTFAFLACMALLQAVFAWGVLPETKGKTLEEIEEHWARRRSFPPSALQ